MLQRQNFQDNNMCPILKQSHLHVDLRVLQSRGSKGLLGGNHRYAWWPHRWFPNTGVLWPQLSPQASGFELGRKQTVDSRCTGSPVVFSALAPDRSSFPRDTAPREQNTTNFSKNGAECRTGTSHREVLSVVRNDRQTWYRAYRAGSKAPLVVNFLAAL